MRNEKWKEENAKCKEKSKMKTTGEVSRWLLSGEGRERIQVESFVTLTGLLVNDVAWTRRLPLLFSG